MRKFDSKYLNLFHNDISRDLILRLLGNSPIQSLDEYFSKISEITETAKNNLSGELRNQLIDFINLYAKIQIYKMHQEALEKAKQSFQHFRSSILRKGFKSISIKSLESEAQNLSPLAFSLFIHAALNLLKNHREVIHTPTWYGEYVSYSEPYRLVREWVDKACETAINLEDFSTRIQNWFQRDTQKLSNTSWNILFSPLILAVALAFLFRFPSARAEGLNSNRVLKGEIGKSDVFKIIGSEPITILNWEAPWTSHSGYQSVWDTIDISALSPKNTEILRLKFFQWQNDTHLYVDPLSRRETSHIIYKDIPLRNFCLSTTDEFIVPKTYIYIYYCDNTEEELKLFPNTPFVNLKGYEAVPFKRHSFHYHNNETFLRFPERMATLRISGDIKPQFFNLRMSQYLNENPMSIYYVNSETKSMALTLSPYDRSLQKAPAFVLFDLPEPNVLMRALAYQNDTFTVDTGKTIVEFTGKNLEWFCKAPGISLLFFNQETSEAYIDCSPLGLTRRYSLPQTQRLYKDLANNQGNYFKFLSPSQDKQCIQKGRQSYSPNIQFETNAPWVKVKLVSFYPEKINWIILNAEADNLVRNDSNQGDFMEGCPGMIRHWLSKKPFLLKNNKKRAGVLMEFTVSQTSAPAKAVFLLDICKDSVFLDDNVISTTTKKNIEPSAFLLLWQNGRLGILFKALGGLLASIIALSTVNRSLSNRNLQKMKAILADLRIPLEFQDELSQAFLAKNFYSVLGRKTFLPRSGIRDICSDRPFLAAREEAEWRIKQFDLDLDSLLEEANLEACLAPVEEENREKAKELILAALENFKIEAKNSGLSLLLYLRNHNFFRAIKLENIIKDFILENKGLRRNQPKLQAEFRYQLSYLLILKQPIYKTIKDQLRLSGFRKTFYKAALSLKDLQSFHQQIKEGKINLNEELMGNQELLEALNDWIEKRSSVYFKALQKALGIDFETYQQLFDLCLKEYEYRFELMQAEEPIIDINNSNLGASLK